MTAREIGSEAVDTALERATGIPVVTSLKDVVTGLPKTIIRIIRRNANEAGENAGKAVLGTADSGDATRTLDNASVETSRGTDGAVDANRPATRDPVASTEAKIEPGGEGAGKYGDLLDPRNVGSGKDFTPATKKKILERNRAENDGVIRSDQSGTEAVPSAKSQSGVTPPSNEAQIDHIVPKSKGGTNSPSNAQVLTREENRRKSNN